MAEDDRLGDVDTTVVRVRGVPVEVVATLKARAEAQGESLAAFLRNLLAREASMPPVDEVMADIARREPVLYSPEDLIKPFEDGRR